MKLLYELALVMASVPLLSIQAISISPTQVTIGFLGDVMLGRGVNEELKTKSCATLWGNLLPFLQTTDFNIANLETTLTTYDKALPKVFNFKSDPKNVACLQEAHIAVVNLANNHSLDYGIPGLRQTLQTLQRAAIKTVGAGATLKHAQDPAIIEKNGLKIAVIGFTDNEPTWLATEKKAGTNYVSLNDFSTIIQQIKNIRSSVDAVIVSAHWGGNWPKEPTPEMRAAGHAFIDAGALLIHGHSAHITLGVESYHDGLILYSTGDAVDDYAIDPLQRNDYSIFYQVTLEKINQKTRIKSLLLTPIILTYAQTNRAGEEEGKKILERARHQSQGFKPAEAW